MEFLPKEYSLQPGIVAFRNIRYWVKEQCKEIWQIEFYQDKARVRVGWPLLIYPIGYHHKPLGGDAFGLVKARGSRKATGLTNGKRRRMAA